MRKRQTPRCIIVFGRYPVPGSAKTRLIPAVGPLGAAELQRRFAETCLATVSVSSLAPVTFCYTGGSLHRVRRWLRGFDLNFTPQIPGDLGQRMEAALNTELSRGCRKVVLIGTDVPEMRADHIEKAFHALEDHDLVLGPATDGGYWLVGVRKPAPVFQAIAWGTGRVLEQTLAAAGNQHLSAALLAPMNDIDTPEDLASCRRRPYLSVIIPALNEQAHIGAVIDRVLSSALPGDGGIDAEVIVVDGGSIDDTVFLAKKAGAKVIAGRRGRAAQQNLGARQACGEVLLFLHADTLLPIDFREQVFEILMDPTVSLGAFQFKTDYDSWGMRLIEKTVRFRSLLLKMPYGDQAFFMRKETFERVGGFACVPIAEDLFMARRLGRLGHIALAPGQALTSGRRWRTMGVWRATLVNYLVAVGCLFGVDPARLAPLYKLWTQTDEKK